MLQEKNTVESFMSIGLSKEEAEKILHEQELQLAFQKKIEESSYDTYKFLAGGVVGEYIKAVTVVQHTEMLNDGIRFINERNGPTVILKKITKEETPFVMKNVKLKNGGSYKYLPSDCVEINGVIWKESSIRPNVFEEVFKSMYRNVNLKP